MKYLMDYHLHSLHSMDSDEDMKNICEMAIKNDINEICFTEHYSKVENDRSNGYMKKEDYIKDISLCKKLFPELKIKTGLEIGESHINKHLIKEDLNDLNIDFIIGSLHKVNGKGITKLVKTCDIHELYLQYFDNLYEMINNGDFDVVGHLDLVQRYAYKTYGYYKLDDYKDKIEDILKRIIERGKGIEVNTSTIDSIGEPMPRYSILKMYYDLGGRIITVGSDSHVCDTVGKHIDKVYEKLKKIGFTEVYAYENRKPVKYKI